MKYITILFFVVALFFVSNSSISAGVCSTNTGSGQWSLCDIDPESGLPTNCINTGGGGSQEAYQCCLSAGTSTCQAPTGCECGTNANGTCRSCGAECWNGTVNCAPGATIALDQPLETRCARNPWGGQMCSAIGTAQRYTDNPLTIYIENGCSTQKITTYNCCASGSTSQCTWSPSGSWTGQNCDVASHVLPYSNRTKCPANTEFYTYTFAGFVQNYPRTNANRCYHTVDDDGEVNEAWYGTTTCTRQVKNCTCVSTTPTCTVDVNPQTIAAGASTLFPASIPASSGTITQVNFTSSNPAVATVTTPDTTPSYGTTATGLGAGTTTITASVVMSGSVRCTDTATLTVTNTSAWWQVRDGDVTVGSEGISSAVPLTRLFNLDGSGGFPGVAVYNGGGLSFAPGAHSTRNWSANTQTTLGRIFDYAYFENLIPDSINPTSVAGTTTLSTAGVNMDGYEIFKASGNLQIDATSLGNRKVILLVDNNGNLTINGTITVNDNAGFFGAFVDGNINVNSTVTSALGTPALEGIYLADGRFNTSSGAVGTSQLHVRGSVAALGGIDLLRNLTNNSNPAELFEYAPDQILLFPNKLAYRRTKWAEIAP